MKVYDLSGAELDYWVAKAEGWEPAEEYAHHGYESMRVWRKGDQTLMRPECYSKNANLALAIFDREGISLLKVPSGWRAHHPNMPRMMVRDKESGTWHDVSGVFSSSLQEAGFRCYVASKFGEEVSDEQ